MSIGSFNSEKVTKQTSLMWWICFGCAVGVGIYSLVCPPAGEIHKSVLEFIAFIFGFMALAVAREAIKEGMGIKLQKGDTTIELRDNEQK